MSVTPRALLVLLLAMMLTAVSACEGAGTAQGGASENGARGRVKVGIPF